jgi:[ribosomal protein S18]-alanine N-acetyltransferase
MLQCEIATLEQASFMAQSHALVFHIGWSEIDFEGLLSKPTTLAHILTVKNTPIGFIISNYIIDEAEIITMVIHPKSQGQGLSHLLLKPHLEALTKKGVKKLHLEVNANNEPAKKLYSANGFLEIGRRPFYYQTPNERQDALILEKTL